jgi:hypothetical protein
VIKLMNHNHQLIRSATCIVPSGGIEKKMEWAAKNLK